MKKKLIMVGIAILPSIMFGWGDNYKSYITNANFDLSISTNLSVSGGDYRFGYSAFPYSGGSAWEQKDNFSIFLPQGTKKVTLMSNIAGSINSMDVFFSFSRPNDDIYSSNVYNYATKLDSKYGSANNPFNAMENGGTVYFLGQPALNFGSDGLENATLNKYLYGFTSNKYYCDTSIPRREARVSLTTGNTVTQTSQAISSSGAVNSNANNVLPIIGETTSSATIISSSTRDCSATTYDSGMKWNYSVEFIFNKSFVDSQVSGTSSNCIGKTDASGGDVSKLCTFLENNRNNFLNASQPNGSVSISSTASSQAVIIGSSSSSNSQNVLPISSGASSSEIIIISSSSSSQSSVNNGNIWQLLGSGKEIPNPKDKYGAEIVWSFEATWTKDPTVIKSGAGFWIKAPKVTSTDGLVCEKTSSSLSSSSSSSN